MIALSILVVGYEVVRAARGHTGLTYAMPWVVAFGFGLLHGFGFAGALAEIGLPQNAKLGALLLFNLGVETGQLMIVAGRGAAGALDRDSHRGRCADASRWALAIRSAQPPRSG